MCLNEIRLLRRRLLFKKKSQIKKGGKIDKLYFNGEFTSQGNFRGEDVYQFLEDLEEKMGIFLFKDFGPYPPLKSERNKICVKFKYLRNSNIFIDCYSCPHTI